MPEFNKEDPFGFNAPVTDDDSFDDIIQKLVELNRNRFFLTDEYYIERVNYYTEKLREARHNGL